MVDPSMHIGVGKNRFRFMQFALQRELSQNKHTANADRCRRLPPFEDAAAV